MILADDFSESISDKNDYSSAQHLKRHVRMIDNMNLKH